MLGVYADTPSFIPGLSVHLSTLRLPGSLSGREPLPFNGYFWEPLPWGQGLEAVGLGTESIL